MKEMLQDFVEEAFNLKDMTPDDALVQIILKHKDDINEEMIKRLVEMFNVKMFKKKQDEGVDLEESFPIATTTIIIKRINEVPQDVIFETSDPVVFKGIDDKPDLPIDLRDYHNPIEIVDVPVKQSNWIVKEIEYKIKNAAEACSEYILNLKKANNETLYKELRFLFPNSKILKLAGLDVGDKKIPTRITPDHEEFEKVNNFFLKTADKDKKIEPMSVLDLQDVRGVSGVPVIPIPDTNFGIQFVMDNKKNIKKNLIDFGQPVSELNPTTYKGGYSLVPNFDFKTLDTDRKVTSVNGLEQALNIATSGGMSNYVANLVNARKESDEDIYEKKKKFNTREREKILEPIKDFSQGFSTITQPALSAVKTVTNEISHLQDKLHNLKEYWTPESANVTPGDILSIISSPTKKYLGELLATPTVNTEYMKAKNMELLTFLRRKNIFESIVENDPNLQGADTNQLLRYYRDITQIAPNATLQPELTRSLLNAANAIGSSAIDPATALNLVKLEERLSTIRNPRILRKRDEDDF